MLTKDNLINTVTLVNADDGNIKHTGTGLFFKYERNNRTNYSIISNKHIFKNNTNFSFSIPIRKINNSDMKVYTVNIKITPLCHSTYDLGIIGINDAIDNFKYEDYILDIQWISINHILTQDIIKKISNIEKVFMIGYPHGLSGDSWLCPIVKSGITATPLQRKYNNREEFLIDILSFKGSSGSPLYVQYNRCFYLAGIHYSELIDNNTNINTGLGVNINSNVILDWVR